MGTVEIVLIFILILIIYHLFNNSLKKIRGSNNKIYYVQRTGEKRAVKKLEEIDNFISQLVKHLKNENPNDLYLQKQLNRRIDISEIPKHLDKNVAYTVNKRSLHICLRNKKGLFETQNNRIYFVIMHELGHIITDEVGHTPKFWRNFKKILKTAIKHKLYKYRDYYIDPVEFCNIIINSTPLKI